MDAQHCSHHVIKAAVRVNWILQDLVAVVFIFSISFLVFAHVTVKLDLDNMDLYCSVLVAVNGLHQ